MNSTSPAASLPEGDISISVLQHAPTPVDVDAGLSRLNTAAAKAASNGSSLLVSPECGVTGYDISEKDARLVAFERDSSVAQQIADIARAHTIAIVFGFMETDGHKRYNSIQLVDADGKIRFHYRKTHLWGELDRRLFSAGNELPPVISLAGWNISTLICYDIEFPEMVRTLALAGAQLIVVPTALMQPFRYVADQVVPVRAAESQVFIAYANLVGRENDTVYHGLSTVAGPDGVVLSQASDNAEALLHVTLDAAALRHIRTLVPYLNDRRPELYAALGHPKHNSKSEK